MRAYCETSRVGRHCWTGSLPAPKKGRKDLSTGFSVIHDRFAVCHVALFEAGRFYDMVANWTRKKLIMNTDCAKREYGRITVVRFCLLFACRHVGNDLWPAHRSLEAMREEQKVLVAEVVCQG